MFKFGLSSLFISLLRQAEKMKEEEKNVHLIEWQYNGRIEAYIYCLAAVNQYEFQSKNMMKI